MAPELFVHRLRQVVRRAPAAPAIAVEGRVLLSYETLWAEANQVAETLRALDLSPGEPVGLQMQKSAEYVVGLLGVWLAGAAFVPLAPDLPEARLAYIVDEANIHVLLNVVPNAVPKAAPESADAMGTKSICVIPVVITGRTGLPPAPSAVGAEDTAYIVYTSGSTGMPKGVVVPQRGLVNLIDAQIAAFALQSTSRVLWLLSPSFDASVSDLGTCLLAGACLFIEDALRRPSSASLLDALAARQISHVDLPPSLLALMPVEDAPSTLRTLVVGGEVCPPKTVRSWARHCRVVNVYGPSETTVCSSLSVCDEDWTRPWIGDPLPGVEYWVGSSAELVTQAMTQPGEVGELYIGGLGVAKGYLGQPALTATKFVVREGRRWFRTGDRVRLHPGGGLEFVGRVDRQFKSRGVLIAPEEIEQQLRTHPGVDEAVVVAEPHLGRNRIIAYYAGTAPPHELRKHLLTTLPAAMIPDMFEPRPALPRTHAGKVDVKRLRRGGEHQTGNGSVASLPSAPVPSTQTEKTLARCWRRVLKVTDVYQDSDFFDLGGDSLSAVEMVVLAQREGLQLGVEQVYACRRLDELARSVDRICQPSRISCATLRKDPALTTRWQRRVGSPVSASASADSQILLTGATGFLGGEVLRNLVKETNRTVICLVRAESKAAASLRIDALNIPERDRARVVALRGDIAIPRLGLDETEWRELSQKAGEIYHCAAEVNLTKPFDALRGTNVVGTEHILRLVEIGVPKTLHYASTLSIFVGSDQNKGLLREDTCIEDVGALYGGYAQSKWVAEMLVYRAAETLGTIRIYRFGLLTGDSRSGLAANSDWLRLIVRGLAKIGAVPEFAGIAARFDVTPIDYAAATMVQLAQCPDQTATFHIANTERASMADLVEGMERQGVELRVLPAKTWLSYVSRSPMSPEVAAAVMGMQRFLPDHTAAANDRGCDLFQASHATFDAQHVHEVLGRSFAGPPAVSKTLLDTLLSQMLECET